MTFNTIHNSTPVETVQQSSIHQVFNLNKVSFKHPEHESSHLTQPLKNDQTPDNHVEGNINSDTNIFKGKNNPFDVSKRHWETLRLLRQENNNRRNHVRYTNRDKIIPIMDLRAPCTHVADKVACFNNRLNVILFWNNIERFRSRGLN